MPELLSPEIDWMVMDLKDRGVRYGDELAALALVGLACLRDSSLLEEAISHLAAADCQRSPRDDQIIAKHVESALDFLRLELRRRQVSG